MPRELDAGELDEFWTLTADELKRAGGKRDANALAFALLFKFFVARGRFPHGRAELPDEAVKFVAGQVRVPASDLESYDWSGRTVERHRAEIRELLGFRECSVADYTAAADWLVEQVTQVEREPEQVRVELLSWLRQRRLEPPAIARLNRIVRSALDRGEKLLLDRICAGLKVRTRTRLNELVFGVPDEPVVDAVEGQATGRDVLTWVKTDPGRLSLNTMLDEIGKLEAIRSIGLPAALLATIAPKIVPGWRVPGARARAGSRPAGQTRAQRPSDRRSRLPRIRASCPSW